MFKCHKKHRLFRRAIFCTLRTIFTADSEILPAPLLYLTTKSLVDSVFIRQIIHFTPTFEQNHKKHGSMLALFLVVFICAASVRNEWLSNLETSSDPNEIQEMGVLIHERSKILLAGKFTKVKILVPFRLMT